MKIFNTKLLLTVAVLTGGFPEQVCSQQTDSPVAGIAGRKAADVVPEKMYIHLDRPVYLAGETIWFKMTVTDEHLFPSDLSRVGYLEVISSEQQPVIQAKVELKKGKGNGAVQIPADVPSGSYLVRGYTNWMKNFSASHFFEAYINLVNPFVPLPGEAEAIASGAPDLQFFPEGGAALYGVENKIAFRAQGADGRGLDFSGRIVDQDGRVVAGFKPRVYGIGHFLFRPEKGYTYKAEITDPAGNRYTFPFEAIREDGSALRVSEKGDRLHIQVSTHTGEGSPLHLLLYNGEKSLAFQARVSGGGAAFLLEKSKLKPGVNVLAVLDQDLKPVAGRLYFNKPPKGAVIAVSPGKSRFGKREKLSLAFKPESLGDTLEASVAVFLSDSLPEPVIPSVDTYLLLSSELKGRIENPEYYLREDSPDRDEELDNLMLTHGWRRYKTDELLSEDFKAEFLPEMEGHLIKGRIVSGEDARPLAGRPVFAAFPSAKAMPWVGISDQKGDFLLETRNFTGFRELVVQTNYRMDSTCKIVLESPFFPDMSAAASLPPLSLPSEARADVLKRSINMQTRNSYFPFKKVSAGSDSIPFYGKADYSYYLDDYTRFPTMEEVLGEYVPAVMVRLRKGKYYTRVVETGVHTQLFTEDPLLLMDGIPVFDTDRVIHFDPLKVKKAEVVNRMYYLGALAFPGIVSYSTYTHDLSGFEVDPRALIIAYDGTLEHREFYSPVYDRQLKNGQRLPDLRNLLYWSPSVRIGPGGTVNVDFYTSDQAGRYKVVLQGITENGIPVSAVSGFSVSD